jgi:transmembrane sensor
MTEHRSPGTSQAPPDWEAIARYQAGESPADEARAVATWLAANPQDAALLTALDDALEQVLVQPAIADASIDVEAALRVVKARRDQPRAIGGIGAAAPEVLPMRPRATTAARRRSVWLTGGGLAAAAALALLLRSDGATPEPGTTTSTPASPATTSAGARVLPAGDELHTAVGVRDSVRLPDGSGVILAPGSHLVVASDFGRHGREVVLEGQAHFTAVHDAARPLTVRVGDLLVRDLGTVFTVRTDGVSARTGVDVAVTQGRVAVLERPVSAGHRPEIVLEAGDRVRLGDSVVTTIGRGVVRDEDVAWATTGTLTYRAAPLSMVVADLRRWYGIDLRVEDRALATRRLTATFGGVSADEVLRVVSLALGATVTRDGNTAVLRPAGAAVR